ncbi:MAG TPA: LysR family transcriptional regulator, partial [Pirellulales bacterium]|nr:LysR family transcriptional regulator [Pirellulales bacterium]
MSDDERAIASEWSVGVRVWIERHGRALLGPGRLELLEAIDQWRSISAAAREIGMSYRRAWLLVQSINDAADGPLVEAAVGGLQGGGARLTNRGRHAAGMFRQLQGELRSA